MQVKGWNIEFSGDYNAAVIGCTIKSNGYTVAVRRNGIFLMKRRDNFQELPTEVNNLPETFAKHLSGEKINDIFFKKELTRLRKLGNLIGIEINV